ncbi:hypothetical protein K456DRAFT_1904995 [Colletotrichum gloeosporioides 23]|nr:hypothetical protein K456DRAFT_1904995 [Colletotrichum gloeosporioides 23]
MALSSVQHTSVRPAELHSISKHPRYVRIAIEGDVGAYLATIQPKAPPSTAAAPKVDGSISVCGGDETQTGWVDDYFGLSDGEIHYGRGVGWLSQEADMMENAQWPRKFVCSWCSERWNVAPWPQGRTLKIPYRLADRGYQKHLNGNKKKGHGVYLSGLAGRIKNHGCLSKTDQAVSSRLMNLFNDLDSRGQIPMSQSVRTVLGADEISSPAVVGEHRQWMVYLGLHAPETFKAYFFDVKGDQWNYRLYNLDDPTEKDIRDLTGRRTRSTVTF